MSVPYVTMVTSNDWCVSYETPGSPDGGTRLHVFWVDHDAPNEMGGRSVVHRHPVAYGLLFADVEQASWYAYEHGFLGIWSIGGEKLPAPFYVTATERREDAQ